MKAQIVKLSAECTLTLTEKEVALLHECFSYNGLAETLSKQSPNVLPLDEAKALVESIRTVTGDLMKMTGEARTLVFPLRYGK